MRKLFLLLVLLACNVALHQSSEAHPHKEVIHINAIDWCPQICLDDGKPGYVIELIKTIFDQDKFTLDIQIYPWSRAIKNVETGKADALLSPAKKEAPKLLFPKYQVGNQQMCFFTLADSSWQYQGIASLKGIQVGIAVDTSIEELNDYVKKHPDQFQFQPYHERYVAQNLAKLKKGRMDTFLFTKNTTNYILSRLNEEHNFKSAGCVSSAPIYIAFSPSTAHSNKIARLITEFDSRYEKLAKTDYVKELKQKYNITN